MGHWAMMVSLSVATVDAGGKRLGPMSVPSGSRNLISNCSWTADISRDGKRRLQPDAAESRGHLVPSTREKGKQGARCDGEGPDEEPIDSLPRTAGGADGIEAPRGGLEAWSVGISAGVRFLGPGRGSGGPRRGAAGADHRCRRIDGGGGGGPSRREEVDGEGGRGRGRQGEERRQWRGWELEVAGKGKEGGTGKGEGNESTVSCWSYGHP